MDEVLTAMTLLVSEWAVDGNDETCLNREYTHYSLLVRIFHSFKRLFYHKTVILSIRHLPPIIVQQPSEAQVNQFKNPLQFSLDSL